MYIFDWQTAKETLLSISFSEIEAFLASPRTRHVYGIGYFCHNSYGHVLLVANSTDYHERAFRDFCQKYGLCDEDEFKWQIGNWEYPAGIAEGCGQQSKQYTEGWRPYREKIEAALTADIDNHPGGFLREACSEVLRKLIRNGAFRSASQPLGFTVMDVDDLSCQGLRTKLEFDTFLCESSGRKGDKPGSTHHS
jgi:hypothetical protein